MDSISAPVSTPLVSSHMETEAEIFKHVIDSPLLNVSQTPPIPPVLYEISHSDPIPTTITFHQLSHISTNSSRIPIFTESTTNFVSRKRTTTKPPPETSTFESHREENRTPDIDGDTSDGGPNVNIGVNLSQPHVSEPSTTSIPPIFDHFDK